MKIAGLALAGLVAMVAAQTPVGVLAGAVRDAEGGVIPGATITANAGGDARKVVTDAAGRYRFEGLATGTYRVDAELAGFRRSNCGAVLVRDRVQGTCNITLRIGILANVDYVWPIGGLPGALRAADAVIHLRVARVVGPRLLGRSESVLATEHVAVVLSVLKGATRALAQGRSVHFWQPEAGEWLEDGGRFTGKNQPHRAGDEFVGLFASDQAAGLHEFVGGHFMFRVIDGKVPWKREPWPGIQDGMPVNAFLAALRALMS